MKPAPVLSLLFVLVFVLLVPGCMESPPLSSRDSEATTPCPSCCDDTAVAIGIAMNDPEVGSYLTGMYRVAGVNLSSRAVPSPGGNQTASKIFDVVFDTPESLVLARVTHSNCSVIAVRSMKKSVPPVIPPNTTTINPVGDHVVGDVFTVSGMSPLPAANLLFLEIVPVYFKPPPWDEHPRERTTMSSMVQTVDYRDGVSRWYYAVNTTSLLPDMYEIWVWSDGNDPYWEGTPARFNLSGKRG